MPRKILKGEFNGRSGSSEKEFILDELQKVEQRITRRAYDIFQGDGSIFGKDVDHWFTAERELLRKPAIELKEKDNKFELQIAVAGVDPKDLQIDVTPEGLLVKGETKTETKEEKGTVHTREIHSGSLFRSIPFSKKVNTDKVKAEINNGLLTVTAPIAEEEKARKINVQAA